MTPQPFNPNLPRARLARLAALSDGYTYCVARRGVTGVRAAPQATSAHPASPAGSPAGPRSASVHPTLIAELRAAGAPPPLVGFGVAAPCHVRAALAAGAAGAISGSAIAALIEGHLKVYTPRSVRRDPSALLDTLATFLRAMKDATLAP